MHKKGSSLSFNSLSQEVPAQELNSSRVGTWMRRLTIQAKDCVKVVCTMHELSDGVFCLPLRVPPPAEPGC